MKKEHKRKMDPNPYDLNGDGCVDHYDYIIFRAAFGSQVGDDNYNAACDFNGDGVVDAVDFNDFRNHMQVCD